jgi:hypothetical protein
MRTFICFILLLSLLHSPSHAQNQVRKGSWIVSHSFGGIFLETEHNKAYEEGVLDYHQKNTRFGFSVQIESPEYGGLYASHDKREDLPPVEPGSKYSSFGVYLRPEIGYFVKQGLLIGTGVQLGFAANKSEPREDQRNKGHSFELGLSPFLRYYFIKDPKAAPFIGVQTGFALGTETGEGDYYSGDAFHSEQKSPFSSLSADAEAGYAWFLGKHWSIELMLGYYYSRYSQKSTSHSYTNDVLNPGYPKHYKSTSSAGRLGLNTGVSFTF